MMRPGPSRDYYLKKRAEGLLHVQALLALACRRVDVLWAMLRDKRCFTLTQPPPKRLDTIIETHSTRACGRSSEAGWVTNEAAALVS
jgi:hypothetical protein